MNPNLKVIVDLSIELNYYRKENEAISRREAALQFTLQQVLHQAFDVIQRASVVNARSAEWKALSEEIDNLNEICTASNETLQGNFQ